MKTFPYFDLTCEENGKKLFRLTGEKRAPFKGEYYTSGAIPEVYQANNNLSQEFRIVKEV